jgi:bacterioferritin
MYDDWGLTKLYARLDHEREEETQHADAIIKRILFLGGVPDLNNQDNLKVGSDVISMLKNDLALEYHVVGTLKAGIKLCEEEQDYITRDILKAQLLDTEEDHAYWLEKQLGLIDKIGLQNYLQSQL